MLRLAVFEKGFAVTDRITKGIFVDGPKSGQEIDVYNELGFQADAGARGLVTIRRSDSQFVIVACQAPCRSG